jgi:hypothetical protein
MLSGTDLLHAPTRLCRRDEVDCANDPLAEYVWPELLDDFEDVVRSVATAVPLAATALSARGVR